MAKFLTNKPSPPPQLIPFTTTETNTPERVKDLTVTLRLEILQTHKRHP